MQTSQAANAPTTPCAVKSQTCEQIAIHQRAIMWIRQYLSCKAKELSTQQRKIVDAEHFALENNQSASSSTKQDPTFICGPSQSRFQAARAAHDQTLSHPNSLKKQQHWHCSMNCQVCCPLAQVSHICQICEILIQRMVLAISNQRSACRMQQQQLRMFAIASTELLKSLQKFQLCDRTEVSKFVSARIQETCMEGRLVTSTLFRSSCTSNAGLPA